MALEIIASKPFIQMKKAWVSAITYQNISIFRAVTGGYRRIEAYIHNNLSGDLRAAVVAERFDMSISSLLHIFKKHSRRTYRQYVADARMQAAYQILVRGGRVKEAIYATGYKNRGTFNNAFKKKFKHPPRYFSK